MEQMISIKVALLEKEQSYQKEMTDKIFNLAQTTKDLVIEQTRRIDLQDTKTMTLTESLKEHLTEDNNFHEEIRETLKTFVDSQKKFNEDLKKDIKETTDKLDKRISWLEKWWYTIAGGAAVIGVALKEVWDKIKF